MKTPALLFFFILSVWGIEEKREYNCAKYSDDWRIAQCAASLRQDKMITKFTFNSYLDLAKSDGEALTNYYSVGFTTGLNGRIIGGIVKDPIFTKSLSVSYRPSDLYYKKVAVDLGHVFDKPIALYTTTELKDIPDWNGDMFSSWQHSGEGELYSIYRTSNSGPLSTIPVVERCDSHNKWVYENLPAKMKGVAIHMGDDLVCPYSKDGLMEVVVAEMEEIEYINIEGQKTKIYTVKNAVWANGEFGKPSEAMRSFFI